MNKFSTASMEVIEIINFLKQDLQFKQVWQSILYKKTIERIAKERGLIVTADEIQAVGDRLRREKHLEKAADTIAWLAEQRISVEELEAGICDRLLYQKLAEYLFGKEVAKYFAQHKLDFDQVLLYQILLLEQPIAQEIFYEIKEGEISFYDASHFYEIDERRRMLCGCEGKLYRWSLNPEVAAVVFSAKPGEVIRPIKTDMGYHLFMVEKFFPAELTAERHQEILDKMFRDWLSSEVNYMLYSQPESLDKQFSESQEVMANQLGRY